MTPRIGIDPGLSGALALLLGDECLQVSDMPVAGEKRHRSVSAALLADTLLALVDRCQDRPTVVIERVSAMPKQGVSSTFAFGRSLGIAEGVVGALGLPLVRVTPQVWKRRAGLIGTEKDAARQRAIELFPERSVDLARKKDGGRADAILIGFYGVEEANA